MGVHKLSTPCQALFQVNMQNDMVVVTHHRLNSDIDGEDACQNQHAVFDPLPAMFETAAAVTVFAAQKGAVHAARGTLVVGCGIERYQCAPWSGHSALRSNMFA